MSRKLISIVLCLTVLLVTVPIKAKADSPVELSEARAALLMDASSGKVILEKQAQEAGEVAGLVRLVPLLYVCNAFDCGTIDENTSVRVSDKAASIKGTTAFISPNETIAAGQLIKAAVILTAGDAIYALVEAAVGSDSAAIEGINGILDRINVDAEYDSVMGEGIKLSVSDIAKITAELAKSPTFLKYSSTYMDVITHESAGNTELVNPNRLVRHYSGCFGAGTGSVGSTEYAGSFIVKRGTTTLIAVVAGVNSASDRFGIASNMLDYGFASFRNVELNKPGESIGEVVVVGGLKPTVPVVTDGQATALMPVSDSRITTEVFLSERIEAPVEQGMTLGTLIIKNSSGEKVGEVGIIAAETVERARFGDYFYSMIRSWLRIDREWC